MPQVISASRRTDIPAFYSAWFLNRLKAGHAVVRHPYTRKLFPVSLQPRDVGAIVFWSKNYGPLLHKLEKVEQTTRNLFFHFSITANKELELHTPDYRDAITDYLFLARRYSPEQVIWRYDPICVTDKLSFETHEERFIRCAELLKGHVRNCYFSFVHPYKKVLKNLTAYTPHALLDLPNEAKQRYALRLAERAKKYGIQVFACCNDSLLSEKILKARCIDGRFLSGIFNVPLDTRQASPRKECACTKSLDIGAYDTCAHGCVYCYATTDKNKAITTYEQHNPDWNALTMNVTEAAIEQPKEQMICAF